MFSEEPSPAGDEQGKCTRIRRRYDVVLRIAVLHLDIGDFRFDGKEGDRFDIFVFRAFRVFVRIRRAECVKRILVYARKRSMERQGREIDIPNSYGSNFLINLGGGGDARDEDASSDNPCFRLRSLA